MCREVFADTEIKYTKPATRLTGHLAGYDPAKSPAFEWPDRLKAVKTAIHDQAVNRNQTANANSANETKSKEAEKEK
jgi:hypothetical protein